MASGIYAIISPSGRAYLGSSTDIERRWKTHIRELRNRTHANPKLQHTADKYGIENLRFEIVRICERDELLDTEQAHFAMLPSELLLNIATSAGGGSGPKSSSTRQKISRVHTGRIHSEESRANMRAAHLGQPSTPESRRKQSQANFARQYKSSSPFRCVALDPRRNEWFAYVTIAGRRQYVPGRFATAAEANTAREAFLTGASNGG